MQIEAITTFFMILGAHMYILFIIKMDILMLIKYSHRSPQICWILSLEWLS